MMKFIIHAEVFLIIGIISLTTHWTEPDIVKWFLEMDAYEEYSGQKSRGYSNLMYVNDTQIF